MCCDCCCCCCEREKEITISGVVINAIALIFLIWGVADMVWTKKGAKALYIIGFVFLILTLLGFIGILVLILVRKEDNELQLNQIAKYISITIIVLVTISLVFIIIGEFILLIDYGRLESDLDDYGSDLPSRWWVTAIVPGFIAIILTSVLICCASRLCKKFYDITKVGPTSEMKAPNNVTSLGNAQVEISQINQTNNQFPVTNQINPVGPPNMVITTNPSNGIYPAPKPIV